MTIDVYEGERSMVKDNHLLGLFEMTNLIPAPRGEVAILVSFSIDANGILQVTAEDRATSKSHTITVDNSGGRLSQADIERMVREAEQFAQQDDAARERIEARNQLESLAYQIQSTINDADNIDGDMRELLDLAEEVKDWLEENQDHADKESFDLKYSELNALSKPIMSKLYHEKSSHRDHVEDDEL